MHFVVLLSALVVCAAGVPLNSTKPRIDARIIGGSNADIADFPYQVSLRTTDSQLTYFCGGVIIGEEWMVTAAHCIYNLSVLYVRSGSTHKLTGGNIHNVTESHYPKEYKNIYDYDIAVLKVDPPFDDSRGARAITLAEKEIQCSKSAVVSGWGHTENGELSEILQQLTVQVFNPTYCILVWHKLGKDWTNRQICAGQIGSRKGTCEGDSGGPLVVNGTLVGIVSIRTKPCAVYGKPDFYTNIFAMRDWIRNKTGV